MDALTEMLSHIRSAGALLGRNLVTPPWSLRFADGASMTLVSMVRGEGWVVPDDGQPLRLRHRDIAILNGPQTFSLTDDPGAPTEPLYVFAEAGTCTDAAGARLDEGAIALGVRTCGTQLQAETALLTGSYTTTSRTAERVLATLPPVLVVPAEQQRAASLGLLEAEIAREEPGQQAVLDRLLELVLIGTLRDWLSLPETPAPTWHRAAADPVVGAALTAIHEQPEQLWTVESLARRAQVSRAGLARRFTTVMGESPIAYLTGWRLCLAADLLERSEDTLESIARQVGYSSAYALSAAFTRQYQVRPGKHREMAAEKAMV